MMEKPINERLYPINERLYPISERLYPIREQTFLKINDYIKSYIDAKYVEKIIKNHDSYLFNTLKINPLNEDLVYHYISYHRDKIKKKVKILHFLYDLENLR